MERHLSMFNFENNNTIWLLNISIFWMTSENVSENCNKNSKEKKQKT